MRRSTAAVQVAPAPVALEPHLAVPSSAASPPLHARRGSPSHPPPPFGGADAEHQPSVTFGGTAPDAATRSPPLPWAPHARTRAAQMRASNVVPLAVATGPRPPPRQAPAKGKEGRDARGPPRPARPAAPGGTGGNDRRRREQSVVERRVSAPPPPPPPPAAATTQLGAARSGTWKVEVQHHKLRLDRFIKLAVGGASETFVQRCGAHALIAGPAPHATARGSRGRTPGLR